MRKVRMMLLIWLTLAGFFNPISGLGQPFYQDDRAVAWADSILATMTDEQRIGQLFMVAAYSNKGSSHEKELRELIEKHHIGGLIFFQGGPVRQARMTNRLQARAELPLMIGMDAEWDLAMRLDSAMKLPWPMTLGATNNPELAYIYGATIARHCKRLGVHINFGPVLDVNTNPGNPIIGVRSFGQDPTRVSEMAIAYMKGMQDHGVLACGKHFPGHGDTDQDSHHTLPTVDRTFTELVEEDWMPYRFAIDNGLASVMVAHLNVPSVDESGTPTSLSPIAIDTLLRGYLGFDGLLFTDALNMRGVSDLYPPGEVDLRALLAGNDVLLFAEDVPEATIRIKRALASGRLSRDKLDVHVRRILRAKYGAGLHQYKPIEIPDLVSDLNDRASHVLIKRIFDGATTVISNRNKQLPIRELTDVKFAVVSFGPAADGQLARAVRHFVQVDDHVLDNENRTLQAVAQADFVIAAYQTDDATPWRRYEMNNDEKRFLQRLALQNNVILVHMANPYGLRTAGDLEHLGAVIQSYQNTPDAAMSAAQVIFGAQSAEGQLPVGLGALFPEGHKIPTENIGRLRYGYPEDVGMDPFILGFIDGEVTRAIQNRATPGAQVLVARRGVVVYHKSFGRPTYDSRNQVELESLYDLASITKVSATLPMLMKMYNEGRFELDDELGKHLPEAAGTNKEHLKIIDILTHQAGLEAWIPFYLETLDNRGPSDIYYRKRPEDGYSIQVAEDLYIKDSYRDTIMARILESPIKDPGEYRYSDLGYYLLQLWVERTYRAPLEVLAREFLYQPLGAWTMGFLPRERFGTDELIPTEQDRYFRYQEIHGYVHDQGAAMLGGVAGHAGVFSNANSLALLMQMYLQDGVYGGHQYLRPGTIEQFTKCFFCENGNRRGIGFDKPQLEDNPGPVCTCVGEGSFGHTGFTGTIAWADPEQELVYIFLSNRVSPSADNKKLMTMNTRTNIQEIIYLSILE